MPKRTHIDKPEYEKRDYAVEEATAIRKAGPAKDSSLIHLDNGVILRRKPVPLFLVQRAVSNIEMPEMPVITYDDGRKIANKDDPDYQRALARHGEKVGEISINIVCALGTEIDYVPEDVAQVEDDGWVDVCRMFGVEPDLSTPINRYTSWIKFAAVTSVEDLNKITEQYAEGMGAGQAGVASALESFQDNTQRNIDNTGENTASI